MSGNSPTSSDRSQSKIRSSEKSRSRGISAQQPETLATIGLIRLQKVLADAGVASRRHSEEIIQSGRVSVDGQVVTELGRKVNPHLQKILVDGRPIHAERKVYFMVNKPEGYLSTNDDPAGRQRVIDLLPPTRERLYPVGRLDESSQGLMLVTNDGPLANCLLHPRYQVPKVYRVQVAGHPERSALDSLKAGQEFSEGVFHVDSFQVLRAQGDSTFVEIVLTEGHNREIRRLFARIGHKVMKLQRIAFGPLRLARLRLGDYRHLTAYEISQLRMLANQAQSQTKTSTQRAASRSRSKSRNNHDQAFQTSKPTDVEVAAEILPESGSLTMNRIPRKRNQTHRGTKVGLKGHGKGRTRKSPNSENSNT